MATTYYDFTPASDTPFTFNPVLDGETYAAAVRWNFFGQRWYVYLTDTDQNYIGNFPMVGSPIDYDISIVAGFFKTNMIYRTQNNKIEVTD